MSRCFIISGEESSGNRLMASIIAGCGCAGKGSTDQSWVPEDENTAVIIRHQLSNILFKELRAKGYDVTVIYMVRDPYCMKKSQDERGHAKALTTNKKKIASIPDWVELIFIPYEGLVLHGAKKIIEHIGLEYRNDEIKYDNHIESRITDGNAKYYGSVRPEDNCFDGNSFVWMPEKGIGYFPVKESPYDEAYFEKYKGYANTDVGKKITEARIEFTNKHYDGLLADIGIGCGDFVKSRPNTFGYDVNPAGIKWLQKRGLFVDPFHAHYPSASFWDSLEHINNPDQILQYIDQYVFVSMPIYTNCDHVLRSKHFRKDEHFWYFTREGFINWMDGKGFKLIDESDFETRLGREDILTFAFRRKSCQ